MAYQISAEDVWVGTIEDSPGGLAEKLEKASKAGVNLEFMIARRAPEEPGKGVVFLAPIGGEDAGQAAEQAGFSKWTTGHSLRIHGPDQPGLGAKIARAVADAGASMRGASAATLGEQVVFHLAFDSEADGEKARGALARALNG
ncbi:MAG: ACT domain-containing protein [Phycisphaerae bacterium]